METENLLLQQKKFYYSGKTRNIDFRITQLKILKRALKEYEKEISLALHKDLGKSEFESYTTEIGYTLHEISYIIKNLKKWAKPKKVGNTLFLPFSKSKIINEPYGNVLIISPWNYPIGLTFSPLAGSIAAGNCSIVKPSEISKHTSKIIKEIITKYFDRNFINAIEGTAKISDKLTKSNFDYIFFTGSPNIGKIVMKNASEKLIPITLELGGKSPCIVDENTDLDKAAKRIIFGKLVNAGQTCIAPDYLMVNQKIKNELIQKLIEAIKKFYGEKPIESKDYGNIISKKHYDRIINLLSKQNIVFGGDTNEKKLYISPTVIDEPNNNSAIMNEEIFGPVLPIKSYNNLEELCAEINNKPKPLALYIFSNDKKVIKNIIHNTSSGGVCVNDTILHISNLNLPFGGVGNSGIGRYHGKSSFETFSNKKSIYESSTLFDIPKRYPPTTEKSIKILKKILK